MGKIVKIPELEKYSELKFGNTTLVMYRPQIAFGMAMIPVVGKEVNYAPEIVEESMLNSELAVLDDIGSYNRLSLQNSGDQDVIVPGGTHFTGGRQNRGTDKLNFLKGKSQKITVDCHCFEPGRGSGSNRFNGISETPIDIIFKTMTTSGTSASWGAIEEYTRILNRAGSSLDSFIESTGLERLHLALNYETLREQTGVLCIIGNDIAVLEVYPTKKVFEKNREQIYSGQFASFLYRKLKKGDRTLMTPRDAQINLGNFVEKLKNSIKDQTPRVIENSETLFYKIFSHKDGQFISDVVLNQNDEIAYAFAMQKI